MRAIAAPVIIGFEKLPSPASAAIGTRRVVLGGRQLFYLIDPRWSAREFAMFVGRKRGLRPRGHRSKSKQPQQQSQSQAWPFCPSEPLVHIRHRKYSAALREIRRHQTGQPLQYSHGIWKARNAAAVLLDGRDLQFALTSSRFTSHLPQHEADRLVPHKCHSHHGESSQIGLSTSTIPKDSRLPGHGRVSVAWGCVFHANHPAGTNPFRSCTPACASRARSGAA